MKVEKRDGKFEEFQSEKIIRAIENAMRETILGVDNELSQEIVEQIEDEIREDDLIASVECIQDRIEELLMESDRKDVAKSFIIYRNERHKHRKPKDNNRLLTDDFISKYKHRPSPMNQLGNFVYYRTYSRYLPEEKRREYWWETVRRAVEYNCSLVPTTKEEAEKLFDNVYNLRQFLSGRSFWIANTDVSKHYPIGNYNCFRRDTEFLTNEGIKTFGDFEDGDIVNVLNGNGAWSKATVKNFGKQRLIKLLVNKGKEEREIYTTDNHLWFVDKSGKWKLVETKDLKTGDILRQKRRYEHSNAGICRIGIQHGIVYGDGTFDKNLGSCRLELIGDKQELARYFNTGTIVNTKNDSSTLIERLPFYWKELPPITANIEYLKGFLVGLLAVDGSMSRANSLKISNSNLDTIKFIRDICELNGIITSKIKDRGNPTNFKEDRELYEITLNVETYDSSILISQKHIERYNDTSIKKWKVKEIHQTDLIEDVWCVVEPDTNSFTLSGGLHTHNCAFTVIDNFNAFKDLFYLLMVGAGVGVRVLKNDVSQLPKIRTNVEVIHKEYAPVSKNNRIENTALEFEGDMCEITVGDSKEGWTQSLDFFLKVLYSNEYRKITTIILNYDHVRPKGEKLKTFGGTASGHESLKNMFKKIDKILKNKSEQRVQLRPIDCLDISNIIGENVVVGGVRRTAEIGLIDSDDEECIQAKSNLYKQIDGQWIVDNDIIHRQMSNNSIYYLEKPTRERLHWQIQQMRYSGEPAWVNAEAASKRRPNMNGVNPLT